MSRFFGSKTENRRYGPCCQWPEKISSLRENKLSSTCLSKEITAGRLAFPRLHFRQAEKRLSKENNCSKFIWKNKIMKIISANHQSSKRSVVFTNLLTEKATASQNTSDTAGEKKLKRPS